MPYDAIQMQKEQVENYYILHSSSRSAIVEKDGRTIPALFDFARYDGKSEKAGVKRRSRQPHLSCFSGNVKFDGVPGSADEFDDLTTDDFVQLAQEVDGQIVLGVRYKVDLVDTDLTDESYQADIWLRVIPS